MYYSEEKDIETPISEQLIRCEEVKLIVNDLEIKKLLDKEIDNLFPKNPTLSSYAYDTKTELINAKLAGNIYNYEWLSYFILNMLRKQKLDMPISKIQAFLKTSNMFNALRTKYEKAIVKDFIISQKRYNKISNRKQNKQEFIKCVISALMLLDFNLETIKLAIKENEHLIQSESLIEKAIARNNVTENIVGERIETTSTTQSLMA